MRRLLVLSVVVLLAGGLVSLMAGMSVNARISSVQPVGQIVFSGADPSKRVETSLYVTSSDGKQVRRLTADGYDPTATRDGRLLAFVRDGAIWVMRRDGSAVRRLTNPKPARKNLPDSTGEFDSDPAWSPDKKIVYFDRTSRAMLMTSLYAVRSDGTGLRRLTRPGAENCDWGAAPSPDGRVVAFSSAQDCMRTGFPSIDAITPAGRPAKLPFRWAGTEQSWPVWSPDGRTILYTIEDFDGEKGFRCVGLYLSTTSSSPRRLVRGGCGTRPAWSPDGAWLALPGRQITLIGRNGTGRQPLAATSRWGAYEVAWLPATT